MPDITDLWREYRAQGHPDDEVIRLADEQWPTWPVKLATERGHAVEWDPGRHARWTCTTCSRAVLRVGSNVYGSAITDDCGADVYANLRRS